MKTGLRKCAAFCAICAAVLYLVSCTSGVTVPSETPTASKLPGETILTETPSGTPVSLSDRPNEPTETQLPLSRLEDLDRFFYLQDEEFELPENVVWGQQTDRVEDGLLDIEWINDLCMSAELKSAALEENKPEGELLAVKVAAKTDEKISVIGGVSKSIRNEEDLYFRLIGLKSLTTDELTESEKNVIIQNEKKRNPNYYVGEELDVDRMNRDLIIPTVVHRMRLRIEERCYSAAEYKNEFSSRGISCCVRKGDLYLFITRKDFRELSPDNPDLFYFTLAKKEAAFGRPPVQTDTLYRSFHPWDEDCTFPQDAVWHNPAVESGAEDGLTAADTFKDLYVSSELNTILSDENVRDDQALVIRVVLYFQCDRPDSDEMGEVSRTVHEALQAASCRLNRLRELKRLQTGELTDSEKESVIAREKSGDGYYLSGDEIDCDRLDADLEIAEIIDRTMQKIIENSGCAEMYRSAFAARGIDCCMKKGNLYIYITKGEFADLSVDNAGAFYFSLADREVFR